VAGGVSSAEFVRQNSVEVYDTVLGGGWKVVAPMNEHRHLFGLIAIDDHLMAFGGFGSKTPLCSVEMYSAQEDSWKVEKDLSMSECKYGFGVAVI